MIKKSRPFSNGMEYEFFKECWCEKCRHYKVRENDGFPEFPENGGCRILDSMEYARFDEMFWPSKEIVEEWENGAVKRWHKCLDFERRDDNVGAQPEIIRCKDCKHWDGVDTCDVIDAPVWDNDFCSMAAIDALAKFVPYAICDESTESYTNGLTDAYNLICQLPSAQPERKRGKWIPVTNGRGGHECSLCHSYAPSFQTGNEWLTDYCPCCGADMRGKIE